MNLKLIATMNPLDRGVDDVDAAFERRFAKVSVDPSDKQLEALTAELDEQTRRRLLAWFRAINGRAVQTPAAAVGHAYFVGVTSQEALRDVWDGAATIEFNHLRLLGYHQPRFNSRFQAQFLWRDGLQLW